MKFPKDLILQILAVHLKSQFFILQFRKVFVFHIEGFVQFSQVSFPLLKFTFRVFSKNSKVQLGNFNFLSIDFGAIIMWCSRLIPGIDFNVGIILLTLGERLIVLFAVRDYDFLDNDLQSSYCFVVKIRRLTTLGAFEGEVIFHLVLFEERVG